MDFFYNHMQKSKLVNSQQKKKRELPFALPCFSVHNPYATALSCLGTSSQNKEGPLALPFSYTKKWP
jgi:hypothetical protein